MRLFGLDPREARRRARSGCSTASPAGGVSTGRRSVPIVRKPVAGVADELRSSATPATDKITAEVTRFGDIQLDRGRGTFTLIRMVVGAAAASERQVRS